MDKKTIIGNWKMNPLTYNEAEGLYVEIASQLPRYKDVTAVICAPAIFLYGLLLHRNRKLNIGAEDCVSGDVGAVTGGVSAGMLKELGVSYVIVGHSERRALGETDLEVNFKLRSAVSLGLRTVLCVGESVRDESGEYLNYIKTQLTIGLSKIKKNLLKNLIVAYEPLWAIGTDAKEPARPEDAVEVAIFIRKIISELFGRDVGVRVPVLYGGSVDHKNSGEYLKDSNINGLLVGRASLTAQKFLEILNTAK